MESGPLEGPLGRRHAGCARIRCDGDAQRSGERLEYRLRLMMRVLSTQIVDVQGRQSVVNKSLEELVREVDVESADHWPCEGDVKFESGPAGHVDNHPRQRFVEWNVGVPIAGDPGL